MSPLTSKERMSRILKHQPVDRIGLFDVFWWKTAEKWSAEGHFEKPELISDHFGLDVRRTGGEITPGNYRLINLIGKVDAKDEPVEEMETTRFVRDGNGALLRAGLVAEPTKSLNTYQARWVEETVWHYQRFFDWPARQAGLFLRRRAPQPHRSWLERRRGHGLRGGAQPSSNPGGPAAGEFYASTGPAFHAFTHADRQVRVMTSPMKFIRLVGSRYECEKVIAAEGERLTEADFTVSPELKGAYILLEDDARRKAWTNPLFV